MNSGAARTGDGTFRPPWRDRRVPDVLRPLLVRHRAAHPKADVGVLQRAFDVASYYHSGEYRRSGDNYITHPVAVMAILANLAMDTTTLVAALLHDTVGDTDYTLDQLRDDFGYEVALLVEGVTRLDRVQLDAAADPETARRMIVSMAKDPRVLVIKLADRLHNMRTINVLPQPKREQKARETLQILVPLAERLGMDTIRCELENLAFRTLHPERYVQLADRVREAVPQRVSVLRQVTSQLSADLSSAGITAEVTGRTRQLYSIYQEMQEGGHHFGDVEALVTVRILVDTVKDCYAALGIVRENWQVLPGRFDDHIAMPEFGMIQRLKTTVFGPTGKPVEIQIRTFAMYRAAELGIAGEWTDSGQKDAAAAGRQGRIDGTTWLRQLLDWQRGSRNPFELIDALRLEVFVLTPKGDVIPLPAGSGPVDFAYAIHTQVGHHCIGARVNGSLVSLDSTLANGDIVEILTSESDTAGPGRAWLDFVKTRRARKNIRRYLKRV